jgi:parvulin-like peptidyl-prolyl isomerase
LTAAALCGRLEFATCGQQAPSANSADSQSDQRVVLTIGDEKLTAADIDGFIQSLPARYQTFYSGPGKRLLPQYIIAMKALADEAVKLKLAEQPEVQRAVEIARESVLSSVARQHIFDSIEVTDQQLQELYGKDKALSEEIRYRRILIQTENAPLKNPIPGRPVLSEDDARKKLEDIRQRILAGSDFAVMARQYSEDIATAGAGGDMGALQRDKVIPAILNAAESLSAGQVSNIMQTPSGLEIIQVEVKRTKPFEEVRPVLERELRQKKATDAIQHLTENYHSVIDQEFFTGPATKQNSPPSTQ